MIRLNDKDFYAYNNRGICLALEGKHKEAISDFNKIIELNPNIVD